MVQETDERNIVDIRLQVFQAFVTGKRTDFLKVLETSSSLWVTANIIADSGLQSDLLLVLSIKIIEYFNIRVRIRVRVRIKVRVRVRSPRGSPFQVSSLSSRYNMFI